MARARSPRRRTAAAAVGLAAAAAAAFPARAAGWAWNQPPVQGTPPEARVGHTLTAFLPPAADGTVPPDALTKLVVCGGAGASGVALPGCSALNPFAGWAWQSVVPPIEAAPRIDFTAGVFGRWLLL
jgi:hypothetical protein